MRLPESARAFSAFLVALGMNLQQPLKRLRILYVASDILLAIRRHRDPHDILAILKRFVPLLATLATYSADPVKDTTTYPEVMELVSMWYDSQLFTSDEIVGLYEKVLHAQTMSYSVTWEQLRAYTIKEQTAISEAIDREIKDAKWTLPSRHGVPNDPSAPWYELPAANGLYMKRTRGYPMRSYVLPQGGYELKDGGQCHSYGHRQRTLTIFAADRTQLKKDVQKLHTEMLHAFDKHTHAEDVQDIDAMGNIIFKDPDRPTRNYWGWSVDLIDKRKQLAKDFREKAMGYADVPPPRRPVAIDPDVERARRLAAERASGMGRGRGGGGYPRGGMGGWRGGGGGYVPSGPRGGRNY